MTTASDKRTQGCYIAYHDDWSGMAVFSSEIEALRYGVEHGMSVKRVPFGQDLREAVNSPAKSPTAASTAVTRTPEPSTP